MKHLLQLAEEPMYFILEFVIKQDKKSIKKIYINNLSTIEAIFLYAISLCITLGITITLGLSVHSNMDIKSILLSISLVVIFMIFVSVISLVTNVLTIRTKSRRR